MRPLAWAALTVAILAFPAASPGRAGTAQPDPQAACTDMLQGHGMGEDGRQAMQELMRSGKAPELMDRMMQMARRMGNGDVMVGMTRMMGPGGGMGPGGMMGQTKPGQAPQQ
ncbi:MAG TPA: hypothetical protein VGX21_11540 [Methylomirabilota bacterium]|jgi:hypothetical protein|nr:hypothetical protein [Methylomirabilota bacterium]